MSRKWHVEHADGRPWTLEELGDVYGSDDSLFVLNECGSLGVLFSTRSCFDPPDDVMAYDWDGPAVNERDMVVVWDG